MGYLLMLIVTTAIFFSLNIYFEISLAIVISILFLILWILFNYYNSTIGLFKANISVYFQQRIKGFNHLESMDIVVKSRYPFSEVKQFAITSTFKQTSNRINEKSDLKHLVYLILVLEVGEPNQTKANNFLNKIDSIIDSFSNKYNYEI